MANALLDETRSERIDLGLPWLKQLRVSPTVFELLSEEKPANMSWGDFLLTAALCYVRCARDIRGDFRGSNRLGVRLFGPVSDQPDSRQNGTGNGR